MKGFYIEITNNLLDPKHVKSMGSSVWVYMWCIDKMTSVDEDGTGKVLGGKPIKSEEISQDLGLQRRHISSQLKKLSESGYLYTQRTPYGHKILVNKAKKRFGQKPEMAQKMTSDGTKGNIQMAQKMTNKEDKTVRQDSRQDKYKNASPKGDIIENLLNEGGNIKYDYQYVGLDIYEKLKAPKEKKAECIRLAKIYPKLINPALSFALDYPNPVLKWKMFLWKLNKLKNETT